MDAYDHNVMSVFIAVILACPRPVARGAVMAAVPVLNEAMIRRIATPESFERGRQYAAQGAVIRLSRRGVELQAEVEGNSYAPYRVRVSLGASGIADATCTCPYDWGGACKHIVATLLSALEEPNQVEQRPSLETVLSALDREQLQALLLTLAERDHDLADLIEAQAGILQAVPQPTAPAASRGRRTTIDPATFRRQVRTSLHSLDRMRSSEAYWHVGSVVGEVRETANQARPFLDAGDGRNALLILEAVTEEYLAGWTDLDDSDGEMGELFTDLGRLWTEAILTADLSPDEREVWAHRFARWARDVGEYGIDDAFAAAEAAAVQGWDDPGLQRKLRGESTAHEPWTDDGDDEDDGDDDDNDGDERWYRDELTHARLSVLDRQGRIDEYLNLAAAERQTIAYATMLVRQGRTREAIDHALTALASTDEAFTLARTLVEHGATEDALRVAEHGLALSGYKAALAGWLRDEASAAGQPERALVAARAAVRESLLLSDYLSVEALAGPQWNAMREGLLAELRPLSKRSPSSWGEVLVREGLIDEAITIADASPHDYTFVEKVVDAAVESHPDWVIRTCRAQAERIMNEGASKYYHYAARWLQRARAASMAAGRDAEWKEYMDGLLSYHRRKYSLVPLLKPLV
jgi:uncharacterized Zn finger protein